MNDFALQALTREYLTEVLKRSDAAGDEFYLKEWPEVEGYSFREVLVSFPKATPIGVKEHASQKVVLNPEDNYIIQPGGELLKLLPSQYIANSKAQLYAHVGVDCVREARQQYEDEHPFLCNFQTLFSGTFIGFFLGEVKTGSLWPEYASW